MKLSVPSRFETSLLEEVKILNKKYRSIGKVYGSLPYSIIGHGRVSGLVMQFGEFNMERVKDFSEQAHSIGVDVNYLANSLCLGDLGYEKGGRDKIVQYLGDVYDAGADILTVSSPYLLRLVKREFPSLKVEISVHAHVDTVQKFRRWEELGADIINLPAGSNRDFGLLEAISRSHRVDVELLVNESCLFNCPYALYHHTLSSHRSKHPNEGLDYCMLECVMDRLENTAELLKAPWIRPEDIAYYEKTFKIDKFKIQGRQMPVEWIVKTVEMYSSRKYDGNLLDLISPTYPNWSTRSTYAKQLLQKYNVEDFRRPDVYIDNNLLDEFFSTLVQKGGCSPTQQCSDCSYCDRAAEDLIQIKDMRQFETYATATKQLFEDMVRTPSA
ncbi:MAG: U32 family peptidase [Nitrososphaerales archaeon]